MALALNELSYKERVYLVEMLNAGISMSGREFDLVDLPSVKYPALVAALNNLSSKLHTRKVAVMKKIISKIKVIR